MSVVVALIGWLVVMGLVVETERRRAARRATMARALFRLQRKAHRA